MPPQRRELLTLPELTGASLQKARDLIARCKQHEPLNLPFLLEDAPPPHVGENLYFLCYSDGVLIGAASTWPGREIEVVGAVHPQHRRQGIGSALLHALRQEGHRRGADSLLIVTEPGAPSGAAFAAAMGAQYEFGEHRMDLDRRLYARCSKPASTLDLRPAGKEDLDELVHLWTSSGDIRESEASERIRTWLNLANQRFYTGKVEGRAVGMLRLHLSHPRVFLQSFRVLPPLRGRGYGRQILMGVLDVLVAEQWPHILIEVAIDNAVALALYRSVGFREIASFQYYRLAVESL